MRNLYLIEQSTISNQFTCSVKDETTTIQLIPAKQVLVDSDEMAFIYIVEEAGAFSYLSFKETVWPALLQMVQEGNDPVLQVGNEQIVLEQFVQELEGLLYNIEGNSNYGEAFVQKVETVFEAFYTDNEV